MATDSVMGLFADPQQIQQAQRQQFTQTAADLSQMDPSRLATFYAMQGGYGLGNAIGTALGAEDPQLKMATARRSIMQGLDQNDPKSLAQGAQALNQAGDVQGARALAQAAQALAVQQSQVFKNIRESRTSEQRNYDAALESGYRGSFNDWLIQQKKAGASNTTVSPQIKLPTDINALASGYEKAIEADVNVKNLAGTAKGLINQATTSNNPSAWEAARTQVAKAVGEGKLSNEDIARTGIDPTLIGGVRDWIDKKVVGVPDVKTQQALYAVASYLENTASGRISEKRNNRIKMAQQVNPDINAAEMFPDYSGSVQTPAGGGGKIVDFKDFGKKGK